MPGLQVISSKALSGKTAIAAGIARALAGDGARVQVVRLGAGEAAAQDAATFAALLFASSAGRPLAEARAGAADEIVIIEADAGAAPLVGTAAVLVVQGGRSEADVALAKTLGTQLIGTIATRVPAAEIEGLRAELLASGLQPLAVLPEERALAAPSVGEIRAALGAELLYDGENGDEVVDDVLIAPVYADPARPHFRRFASKAVLTPYNKTDLLLVAIETQAACVVITGGHAPSPYVIDRAQHEPTTLLFVETETPQTVAALSDVWLTSRFRGERKAAVIAALLDGRLDGAALRQRLV